MKDLIEQARKAPFSRDAIAALAKGLDRDRAAEAARAALEAASSQAALVLAFALGVSGAKLEPALVRGLVPELDDIDITGPLVFAASDPMEAILGLFEDRSATLEHEALCVLLAAEYLKGEKAPPKLLVHARYLARHDLDAEARACLGAAAQRLDDADLSQLAASFVASAKRSRKLVEELLAKARRSPSEALPEIAAPRVTSAGFTVRRGKEVGRNDPCPCGSGQKYKKCCAGKAEKVDEGLDPTTLHPDQARALRPSELARLDASRVPSPALVQVVRRAVALRKWARVEELLAVVASRADLSDQVEELRIVALASAFDMRDREAAERLVASLPEGRVDATLELALLRGGADVLSVLERTADRALQEEGDGATMIDLGYTVLRQYPALGILVARGALHEGRPRESTMLLEQIEDARDRLLLPPIEPWWDVFETMVERPEGSGKHAGEQRELKTELRRARAQSRKASTEIAQLKQRLEELDVAIGGAKPKPEPKSKRPKEREPKEREDEQPRDPALEEERRRLRNKVEELQRIIGEGQDERRELRRRLEEMVDEQDQDDDADTDEGQEDEDIEESAYENGDVGEPRNVLVPAFTDRAAKALTELSGPAADVVLSVVTGLASSRENAWGGVKRLEKAKTVHSARAGIHYRVLFTIDDGTLRIHEVVHRRELEQAVNRMVRRV